MSSKALIDKIIQSAQKEAEIITNETIRRAADNEKLILDKARAECDGIKAASDEKCAQIKQISRLSSELESRKADLHSRRKVLGCAYSQAYKRMLSLPDEKRLEFIIALIIKYAPEKDFTVTVSKIDRPLLSDEVIKDLENELFKKYGGEFSIKVSDGQIKDGGVYISGEKADVDLTLAALFEEVRQSTEAEAERLLFPVG